MKKSLWKKWLWLAIPFGMIVMGFFAFGAECPKEGDTYCNPLGSQTDFVDLTKKILGYLSSITVPIAGLAVIIAGLNFAIASASGNPSSLQKAKIILTWVLIGTAIVIGSYEIAIAVKTFLETLS